MIVSCPACATRFSLDASLLGPNGRNVRCAKCGHRWRQEPPTPIEPLPPVELETPAQEPPGMAPGLAALLSGREQQQKPVSQVVVPPKLKPAQPKRKVGLWPWILLLGIVCGLGVAAYIYQGPIARMFPAAQSIFDLLGAGESDAARVLQIGNVKSEQRSGLTSVRADIFNPTDYPLAVPPLMVTALDSDKQPIGAGFQFRTQESEIAPGETITFRILYENPPKGMRGIIVTFGRLQPKS
ncbi:zinc-ribbon domain-containing protein [Dongia sp. agr-C8]